MLTCPPSRGKAKKRSETARIMLDAIWNLPKLVGVSDSVGANDACLWLDEILGEYQVHTKRWIALRARADFTHAQAAGEGREAQKSDHQKSSKTKLVKSRARNVLANVSTRTFMDMFAAILTALDIADIRIFVVNITLKAKSASKKWRSEVRGLELTHLHTSQQFFFIFPFLHRKRWKNYS